MNLRLALKLMTVPTLMASVLTFALPIERASAANASVAATISPATCDVPADHQLRSSTFPHHNQALLVASANLSGETASLNFSEAESDAAAVLFGCDCSSCINALRQLRSPSLLNSVKTGGHCLTSMQRRVSPQKMQEVLQNLELKEAEQVR